MLFFAYCVPRHTFLLSTEENMKENGKTKKKRNEWIECKNALALLVMEILWFNNFFFLREEGRGLKFDFAFEPHPTTAPPLSPTQFSSCRHATKNGCILETSIFGSSPFLFALSWPTEIQAVLQPTVLLTWYYESIFRKHINFVTLEHYLHPSQSGLCRVVSPR